MPDYTLEQGKMTRKQSDGQSRADGNSFSFIDKGIIAAFILCGVVLLITPFIAIGLIPLPPSVSGGIPLLYAVGLGILDLTVLKITVHTAKKLQSQEIFTPEKKLKLSTKLLILALILSGVCLVFSALVGLNILPVPSLLGIGALENQLVYGAGLGLLAIAIYMLLYHFYTWLFDKNMD